MGSQPSGCGHGEVIRFLHLDLLGQSFKHKVKQIYFPPTLIYHNTFSLYNLLGAVSDFFAQLHLFTSSLKLSTTDSAWGGGDYVNENKHVSRSKSQNFQGSDKGTQKLYRIEDLEEQTEPCHKEIFFF